MAVLDFQDILNNLYPDTFEFGIVTNTLVTTSAINGHFRSSSLPGARWRLRMSFQDKKQEDLRELMAFLMSLNGPAGRFFMYDITHPKGAGVTPDSDSITTMVDSNNIDFNTGSMGLVPGDMFSIETDSSGEEVELKMVTTVVNESLSTYTFYPPARDPVLANYSGQTVNFLKPQGKFALTSDDQVYWPSQGKVPVSSIDLEAVEVF